MTGSTIETLARLRAEPAGGCPDREAPMQTAILAALRRSPQGFTRAELRNLFDRHHAADEIEAALAALVRAGKVRMIR
jgi:hypothetical protein